MESKLFSLKVMMANKIQQIVGNRTRSIVITITRKRNINNNVIIIIIITEPKYRKHNVTDQWDNWPRYVKGKWRFSRSC